MSTFREGIKFLNPFVRMFTVNEKVFIFSNNSFWLPENKKKTYGDKITIGQCAIDFFKLQAPEYGLLTETETELY